MKRKIFISILSTALAVFLASMILIMGAMVHYFSNVQMNQLKIETELAAQGVEMEGEDYFASLKAESYRITWIASDGTVLYDNEKNSAEMENHLEREEVKEAIADGSGECIRYSSTLSERQLYYALLLGDGSILRLSASQNTVWLLLIGFIQPILLIVLLAMVLSFVLAAKLAKIIVAPINSIDPDQPEKYLNRPDYAEVQPLMRRMSLQQQQIRHDQEELEKTSMIRQEFTANASHELKTPLHAISGYAELLENGMVREEDIKPFAGKIHSEALRLSNLVQDIINLTQLDGGGEDLTWEETDLYRIAENAADTVRNAADEHEVALQVSGESCIMEGVPHILYSMIYNLADNAIKYNHTGGTCDLILKNYPDHILLTVRDTGIGIPEESQSRIFERFYRVDKSHSKEVGGTGLGLSIVKHGAMIHKAEITLTSKPGGGSTFMISFPRKHQK